ncbi:serine acetyltransferase [Erysipelothrix inopinata]|uniref:Serine acetyltransferase n=2 Tax=Erysipelothrix inopinata TaxID=225084 RepID=A0A7G9S142_9FIRM|nr:serine acetyltransferase [Erysipelothrix inopinata]
MEVNMNFNELLQTNCFSQDHEEREKAAELLEINYNCEIKCFDIHPSVKFAHHARGCTVIASKICEGVVIYQNVTIGSNLRFNKTTESWENVGMPILAKNVIVADGAKILGPVIIGENTVVAAGAIITIDIPKNCIAFGVNKYKERDLNYDLIYNEKNIEIEEILKANEELIKKFNQKK